MDDGRWTRERAAAWARDVGPSQPLTTPVWFSHGRLNRELTSLSDVVSFHNYHRVPVLEKHIRELREHGRPLLCTEFMARTLGSTEPSDWFHDVLRSDGTAFDEAEAAALRKDTAANRTDRT